jgi:hypothetical protein
MFLQHCFSDSYCKYCDYVGYININCPNCNIIYDDIYICVNCGSEFLNLNDENKICKTGIYYFNLYNRNKILLIQRFYKKRILACNIINYSNYLLDKYINPDSIYIKYIFSKQNKKLNNEENEDNKIAFINKNNKIIFHYLKKKI